MPPQTQTWAVDELGRWGSAPERLSRKVFRDATAKMALSRFALQKINFGANKGDTLTFNIYSHTGRTDERRVLAEHEPIPIDSIRIARVKLVVTEFGLGLAYTGKAQKLSEITPKDECVTELKYDYKRDGDRECYLEMNKCPVRYVATGASAGTFTTNGVPYGTCAGNFNRYHAGRMVDFLMDSNAPLGKRGSFWACTSVRAARGIKDDLTAVRMYTTLSEATVGEIGKWENVRYFEETNALKNAIGSGSAGGELFMFGAETVLRGWVLGMAIRSKTGDDFGRNPALAWYCIKGDKLVHEVGADIPKYTIVKFDSDI